MKQKVKEFWNRNKEKILIIGGVTVTVGTFFIIGRSLNGKNMKITELIDFTPNPDSTERKILEGFGAVYKKGFCVPFATREVVEKFLNERGNTYQIDILDGDTSVIWISK